MRIFIRKCLGLKGNARGSVAVETALIMAMLSTFGVGVADYGMVYLRSMELSNAVRAGVQYAIVRHPEDGGDYSNIISAVSGALATSTASSNQAVSVDLYCVCPDGTASDCQSAGGVDIICDDGSTRESYVSVTVAEDHTLMFGYPAVADVLRLSQSAIVRLN